MKFNIIKNFKNEIFHKNKINWSAILFILSEPIALFGAFMMFERGKTIINNPKLFVLSTYFNIIAMFLAVFLRIPYMLNKASAILFLFFNSIAWGACLIIWTIAYYKSKNS